MTVGFPCLRDTSHLPPLDEILDYMALSKKEPPIDVLKAADEEARVLVQPRCGTGGHADMLELLDVVNKMAKPDFLTITVDSHTRMLDFSEASKMLDEAPSHLNGYPVVAHGYERVREINERYEQPVQIRHGSPDGRRLFAESIAGGILSFEGGGIGYNLPYCKSVPLDLSLHTWLEIEEAVGELARSGHIIDREYFGSLTSVIMPPSISIAMVLIEAVMAENMGVRCFSLSYPQGGNLVQDVAALRAIRTLGREILKPSSFVFPVLHQFMGVFPADQETAECLIFFGGLTARLGGATKTVNKTYSEATGLPTGAINAASIRRTRHAFTFMLDSITVREEDVQIEHDWIVAEVKDIIEPILSKANLTAAIVSGFESGRLDIPFPANLIAKGDVMPVRDRTGAIRFGTTGKLPFSERVLARNRETLAHAGEPVRLYQKVKESIFYFAKPLEFGGQL